MTKPAQEILQKALQLSREERADLAYRLHASLADSGDEAELTRDQWEHEWTEEAHRRLRELEDDSSAMIPWDELKPQLEAIVRAPESTA